MSNSKIEWTESTWNPVTGCSKISAGCKNCYAEKMAYRLKEMGTKGYENGFDITLHAYRLKQPLTKKKPTTYFVNSMSDLFHEDIPFEYIEQIFNIMNQASHHTFQILTKRSERLLKESKKLKWTQNIWMGVSIENTNVIYRIKDLIKTNACIKFLSCEPLIGPLPNLNLKKIDWVIVGGESGHKARPIMADWVRDIREQCKTQNVKFFFKQWGGINKKKTGRILDNRTYDEMPTPINKKPLQLISK